MNNAQHMQRRKQQQAATCPGKEAFTKQLAQEVAQAMRRRNACAITPYLCLACGHWHTGNAGQRTGSKPTTTFKHGVRT